MLLSVQATDGYHLDCWLTSGKRIVADPPERPYYYERELIDLGSGCSIEPVEKRLLSTMQKVTLNKVSVPNLFLVRDLRSERSIESQVKFIERLSIDFG